ncbi:MAG: ABC transporter ATP-binding protein, partial [Actinobacteria bacterium]|nr:ABC transporter ATP-binding protein [Actinomycetota bacterium]
MVTNGSAPALELEQLDVVFRVRGKDRQVLRGVTLAVERGESYGLVGESGCGKSTVALAIVRYLARNGRVRSGGIRIASKDVLALNGAELRRLRANDVAMVYQNPGAALNPSLKVGAQVVESFVARGVARREAGDRALEALRRVQIADPSSVLGRYPHQLSGGMQQRAIIAMALAKDPSLLILDEPTTGLDATVEAEVLDLVSQLQVELQTSILFISHNLGVIAKMCNRVGVLYAGRLVEEGPVATVLNDPRHPYTVGLLRCIPRGGVRKDHGRLDTIPGFLPQLGAEMPGCVYADRCPLADERCVAEEPPLAEVAPGHATRCWYHELAPDLPRVTAENITLPQVSREGVPVVRFDDLGKIFKQRGHDVHALEGISSAIWPGETLGLVGESGSGKTTLARALLGSVEPTTGVIELEGQTLAPHFTKRSQADLAALQIIFQNPDSALNRRHSV